MNDNRRTSGRGAYGTINANYYNFKKGTGNPGRGLNRQVWYTVYGDESINVDQKPRGFIYNANHEVERYGDYKAWALGQSKQHDYMYRVYISPKHHILSADDFVSTLREANEKHGLSADFRLVVHTDTNNKHAHVLMPADKTLTRQKLNEWKITIREGMMQREQTRCVEQGLPLPRIGEEEAAYKMRTTAWREAVQRGDLQREQVDKDAPPSAEIGLGDDSPIVAAPLSQRKRRRRRKRTRSAERGRRQNDRSI